ncbi:sigma-54-dependent transcriptional regulator [Duganella sp. LjRoot269]|jgi:two-component system nitrogen regulation response regulator GlnG|uniref:sigma-54-dependent transcriptional regulator n=1 Tax=Duganella sp. LjRoot269 TaxID=3342305 RepID=UPI003ECFED39
MNDADYTLSSPLAHSSESSCKLLGLTILWHPDQARVGQQFLGPDGAGEMEVSRFFPLFCQPGKEGAPLEHRCIARAPIGISRDAADGIRIKPPESRMTLVVDGFTVGEELRGDLYFADHDIARGIVIELGATVLVCMHWIRRLPKANDFPGLLGVSSAVVTLRDQIRLVARTGMHVLLLGETGTGKDVAARSIHGASARARAPLVAVNMATLNESLAAADLFGSVKGAYTGAQTDRQGLFADAGDGTLFLDEIGDTPAAVQPMLLRVLDSAEYRPVGARADVRTHARLICATDQDLAARGFNQALRRRMEAFVIRVPPLRERLEDIGILVRYFLQMWMEDHGERIDLPFAFVRELCGDSWPGNIRQLAHVVRRAALAVQAGEVPLLANFTQPSQTSVERQVEQAGADASPVRRARLTDVDQEAVLQAMHNNGWRVSGAAQELGVSRPSMYKLIEMHPAIRRVEAIDMEELRQALERHAPDIDRCAAALRTPFEPLRRHLRANSLIR